MLFVPIFLPHAAEEQVSSCDAFLENLKCTKFNSGWGSQKQVLVCVALRQQFLTSWRIYGTVLSLLIYCADLIWDVKCRHLCVGCDVCWRSPTRASSWSSQRLRQAHRQWPFLVAAWRPCRSPSPARRPATPSGRASTPWPITRWSSTDSWRRSANGSTRLKDCWNWWTATVLTRKPDLLSKNNLFSLWSVSS